MGTIFFYPSHHYGTMAQQYPYVIWSACAVMLLLACLSAGCASYQSPATPAATTPAPAAGANSISIKNFAFSPVTLMVKTGTSVTWTNDDGASHAIVSDPGTPVTFTSDSLANGASYTFTFTQPGTYTYHCSIHPSMKGTIIVAP